ncbi:hypothetical protein VY88_22475 [Azospirillum thiophilum]|uniref:ABC transporter domain-containing protein n=1 Tax=Azospirillum thiophilum TaxID=528244 RepID=A0AAC8W1U2_9PROT|nr:ABC transporter ATP-binding protein [Azospirillum thiophilum]ALG73589.1 hypothetical protein AL072_21645 [Azospirillum thiophilum]KJR62978.1 hypothetical protein VY88_22475 [Azospirillum thiophilum]
MTARPSDEPLLEVSGLGVRFGGLTAVADVGFAIGRGEIHALIGPNGAGKSTVINCVSGFQQPSGGTIRLDGAALPSCNPVAVTRRGIARTFQTPQLFGRLSVADNLRVASQRLPRTRRGVLDDRELIQLVGLAGLEERAAETLAYGQQRLLEVARALACNPRLLLLDEPAAGLAGKDNERLADLMRRIASRFEVGVLFVEHNVALIRRLSDRITVMHHGLVIATGAPDRVLGDPAVVAAYLGASDAEGAKPC